MKYQSIITFIKFIFYLQYLVYFPNNIFLFKITSLYSFMLCVFLFLVIDYIFIQCYNALYKVSFCFISFYPLIYISVHHFFIKNYSLE